MGVSSDPYGMIKNQIENFLTSFDGLLVSVWAVKRCKRNDFTQT